MFKISKVIHINASRDRIFLALTNSKEILKYYPLNEVQSEWELGSEVHYKGEVNGAPFTDYGVIEKMDSPSVYAYNYWSDNHGTERLPENHIAIRYQLSESNGGTDLTVTQSNIKSAELYELMKDQVWGFLLGSLKEYVEELT